jgi:hypothetical protein
MRVCTGADMEVLSRLNSLLTPQKWCSLTCNDMHVELCAVPANVTPA